ncbi:MAG: hypothetical protein JWO46_2019 [Nocardioidaceae bacterium]|nr:hypothetical protein [Nocardioidaceae bacterium]
MTTFDLAPAADALARAVAGVRDDQLTATTPCTDYSLAALLDHVDGLSQGFGMSARKESLPPGVDPTPSGHAERLRPDWRTAIPAQLADLVAAWREPAAWEGMTSAGGVDLPAGVCASVAADELVLHGWDVARASGQEYDADPDAVVAALAFVGQVASDDGVPGLFGPRRSVSSDAGPFAQLLALTGRDPAWTP